MSSLNERSNEAELLDDLNCRGEEIDRNLRELAVINKWLGGDDVTLNGIKEIISRCKLEGHELSIADLGCGGGDMLIKIYQWAEKANIKVSLTGIDANPYIVEYARKNSNKYPSIKYLTTNIFSEEFTALKFDIITSTLFTHHFTNDDLVRLYAQLSKQANVAILTNDIHRHFLAYHSINLLTSLFSKSHMVKNDAGLSVKRAFKLMDLKEIFKKAGIEKYKVRWKWAFRWQIFIYVGPS